MKSYDKIFSQKLFSFGVIYAIIRSILISIRKIRKVTIMDKLLYDREIDDELMIQFIILYTLSHADEDLAYADLLNIVQGNCEISFTDLQLSLDNLIKTGHASVRRVSDILSVYSITEKGSYVIDFFYKQIPLIIREPIDRSIKEMYIDKRRKEAVKASAVPINEKEYYTECELRDDDRALMLSLRLYAGARDDAEKFAKVFRSSSAEIYETILNLFTKEDGHE